MMCGHVDRKVLDTAQSAKASQCPNVGLDIQVESYKKSAIFDRNSFTHVSKLLRSLDFHVRKSNMALKWTHSNSKQRRPHAVASIQRTPLCNG